MSLARSTPNSEPHAGHLHHILSLALSLSGAPWAMIVLEGGTIAESLGVRPAGVSSAELARFALGHGRTPEETDDHTGLRFFRATPITGDESSRLGVLAVASGAPLSAPDHLDRSLTELAVLAGDELSRIPDSRDERETLFAEADHRVKNVLAAVQSISSQSARRAVSLDGFLKAFSGRLKAMASAQELLTATRWRGASIHDLATATLSALAPGQTRWSGPELFLTPRAANALALALHELAVNAARHGALLSESGTVELRWRTTPDGGFELDWMESGGPRVTPPTHRGFGALLLEGVTGRELDGRVTSEFRAGGVRVRITASAKALAAPARPAEEKPAPSARAPVTVGESSGSATPAQASRVKGLRVIIVEDAVLLAMELEAGLSDAGAKIVGSAALVDEAMALVDLPMDAAVLDCNLNGSSVQPVASALAARGVPFLFATGYGENRGAPEGFDAPIVRKPYDVAQIANALADLTGRA